MKGNKTYRHNSNPLEKQLHDSFVKGNSVEDMSMICLSSDDGMRPDRYLTDDEVSIAISTIQWLGSPVGQNFLSENGFELKRK
jgi:hypothetical protein